MTERPIRLRDDQVLAILRGIKNQHRVPLDPQPPSEEATRKACTSYSLGPRVARSVGFYSLNDYDRLPKEPGCFDAYGAVGFVRDSCGQTEWSCPLGVPGDRLWVQEAWALEDLDEGKRVVWRANKAAAWRSSLSEVFYLDSIYRRGLWRPPSGMPRWASRLSLEIVSVHVHRVQSITEEEARREGVRRIFDQYPSMSREQTLTTGERMDSAEHRASFAVLWDEHQERHGSWLWNPWVWAIGFKVASVLAPSMMEPDCDDAGL